MFQNSSARDADIRCSLAVCIAMAAPPTFPSEGLAAGSRAQLNVSGTCIDALLDSVPLGVVAQALQAKAGIRVTFNDSRTAGYPISARVSSCSIDQSIRKLLNGLSYVVSSSPQYKRVVVLSVEGVAETDFTSSAGISPRTLDDYRRLFRSRG